MILETWFDVTKSSQKAISQKQVPNICLKRLEPLQIETRMFHEINFCGCKLASDPDRRAADRKSETSMLILITIRPKLFRHGKLN